MKLYERFGGRGFHTTLITTFGVDFDAFENIVLTRLRGASCFNTALLTDYGMLAYALQGASALPAYAGRHYTVTGIKAESVFHPKIIVQLGSNLGRLIVASANMTAPGLAGNLELAGEIEAAPNRPGECQLLASAWEFLKRLIQPADAGLGYQLEWMRRRTSWFFDTEPASGPVILGDGTVAAWLGSGESIGIGARFAELIEERPVRRLTILSPYWDADLATLRFLIEELRPDETVVLIDVGKALFPSHAARGLPASMYDLGNFAEKRFIHAKVLIAETTRADHVLYGSANCTLAALGDRGEAGLNSEACLYRRLAPNTVLEQLGLRGLLEGSPIAAATLPAWIAEDDLPLADAVRRNPGTFECRFDVLGWRPPAPVLPDTGIELLGTAGGVLPIQLEELQPKSDGMRQYRMRSVAEHPAFARLRFADGAESAVAVVTILSALHETVREARSRKAESAADRLGSGDAEAELWLLEALNDLEAAEIADQSSDDPGTRRTRQTKPDAEPEPEFRTLTYDEFIRGRRFRSDSGSIERNSLAASELSLVRNFLNRILSIGSVVTEVSEGDAIAGLELGDETADAEAALEAGETFSDWESRRNPPVDEQRAKTERLKATRSQIVAAVNNFRARITDRAETGQMNARDVLRLRAMLMILAAAGQPASNANCTPFQVLPLSEQDDGWPKLIGRVLFCFFGGGRPAIRDLSLSAIYDEFPDDILECWATAFWCCQACLAAAASRKRLKPLQPIFAGLTERVYRLTGLRPVELMTERFTIIMDRLSERFAPRLGLKSDQIHAGHQAAARRMHPALAAQ